MLVGTDARATRVLAHPPPGGLQAHWSPRSELAWVGESGDGEAIAVARYPYESITYIPVPMRYCVIDRESWSPDGTRLLVGSLGPLVIDVVDVDTRRSREVLRLPGFEFDDSLGLSWSPDGSLIAVGVSRPAGQGHESFIAFHSMTSNRVDEAKMVGPFTDGVYSLTWSPKGDVVAFSREREINVIRVKSAN
jgi:WD40 repeat protein